jgi:hypothetical protein
MIILAASLSLCVEVAAMAQSVMHSRQFNIPKHIVTRELNQYVASDVLIDHAYSLPVRTGYAGKQAAIHEFGEDVFNFCMGRE